MLEADAFVSIGSAVAFQVIPKSIDQNLWARCRSLRGHDAPCLIDERVSGEAATVDDVLIGCEDAVRQPFVAHELAAWTTAGSLPPCRPS